MPLRSELTDISNRNGVDFFGVADLAQATDFILRQGGDFIARFPFCISIGIALPQAIVDLLPRRNERAVQVSYRHHAYDVINDRLNLAASALGTCLQKAGHAAFPIPASERVDDERICASFSHKLGAHLSGLGWIGKSCLLITPEQGPRVRWTSVLTDAPLSATGTPQPDRCGDCTKCVDICPVRAFTGRHFDCKEPREARYDAAKCDAYFRSMEQENRMKVCGLCLYVCPFGKPSALLTPLRAHGPLPRETR